MFRLGQLGHLPTDQPAAKYGNVKRSNRITQVNKERLKKLTSPYIFWQYGISLQALTYPTLTWLYLTLPDFTWPYLTLPDWPWPTPTDPDRPQLTLTDPDQLWSTMTERMVCRMKSTVTKLMNKCQKITEKMEGEQTHTHTHTSQLLDII